MPWGVLYQPCFAVSCLCGSPVPRTVTQPVDLLLWMDPTSTTLVGKEHHTKNFPTPSLFLLPLHVGRAPHFTVHFQSELHLTKCSHLPMIQSAGLLWKSAERNRPFKHSIHLTRGRRLKYRRLKIDKMNSFS